MIKEMTTDKFDVAQKSKNGKATFYKRVIFYSVNYDDDGSVKDISTLSKT